MLSVINRTAHLVSWRSMPLDCTGKVLIGTDSVPTVTVHVREVVPVGVQGEATPPLVFSLRLLNTLLAAVKSYKWYMHAHSSLTNINSFMYVQYTRWAYTHLANTTIGWHTCHNIMTVQSMATV